MMTKRAKVLFSLMCALLPLLLVALCWRSLALTGAPVDPLLIAALAATLLLGGGVVWALLGIGDEPKQRRVLQDLLLCYLCLAPAVTLACQCCVPDSTWISPATLALLCVSLPMLMLGARLTRLENPKHNPGLMLAGFLVPILLYFVFGWRFAQLRFALLAAGLGLFLAGLLQLCALAYNVRLKAQRIAKFELEPVDPNPPYSFGYRLLYVVVGILLPTCGLLLNIASENIVGDFSSPWFFAVAVLNGLLLLVDIRRVRYPLILLMLKFAGMTYACYFLLVFLPFTLFGLMGSLVILGSLLLAPHALVVFQWLQLRRDVRYLHARGVIDLRLYAVAVVGLLILPALVLSDMAIDRANFLADGVGDQQRARRTFSNMRTRNTSTTDGLEYFQEDARATATPEFEWGSGWRGPTPILSGVYRAVVLGGRTYPRADAERIAEAKGLKDELISLTHRSGGTFVTRSASSWENDGRFITRVSSRAPVYDEQAGAFRTVVDIVATSYRSGDELNIQFALPQGAVISDYYLDVNGVRKSGYIVNRLTAQQVYDAIVNRRKDPGLLTVDKDRKLRLRVFPFGFMGVRTTGFELMHREPVTLTIEGTTLSLPAGALPQDAKGSYDDALAALNESLQEQQPAAQVELVKRAIELRALNRFSAFTVLETAEQEQALLAAHEKQMAGEPVNMAAMSEPSELLILLAALLSLLIAAAVRRRSQRRRG